MTTAIILAGGMGTRLRSVVPDVPKPLAPVGGRPFLEHQLDYWIDQGINRFVVSVGYMKAAIMDHFGGSYRGTPLAYAVEDEPLGTGGGLLLAARGLKQPFLVLNGDTFFAVDFARLLEFHAEHLSEWTFSLFRTNETGRYMEVGIKADGEIDWLQAATGKPGHLANGGVYLVNPSALARTKFLPGQKLSLENEIIPAFATLGGKLHGLEFSGNFIDIGIPRDYFRAADALPHRRETA